MNSSHYKNGFYLRQAQVIKIIKECNNNIIDNILSARYTILDVDSIGYKELNALNNCGDVLNKITSNPSLSEYLYYMLVDQTFIPAMWNIYNNFEKLPCYTLININSESNPQ